MARRLTVAGLLSTVLGLLAVPSGGFAAEPPDRYTLAGGCQALQSAPSGSFVVQRGDTYEARARSARNAEPLRMQATALGEYLLYGEDRDFLAADGTATAVAPEPSPAADWRLRPAGGERFELINRGSGRLLAARADGEMHLARPGASGPRTRFRFSQASGCPVYPEVRISAGGSPHRGESAYSETAGTTEMHVHVSAFEFLGGGAHCGRPWHRYGAPYALVDCPDHYPDGSGAILENLFYGNPTRRHDPVGWPTFADWPRYDSLTHEQTYYRWIERAWLGGMRIMVNDLVENEVLCLAYPVKKNSCDEMDSVRLQARRMEQLENYVDAQEGGPGEGWFRIVRTPFEARRVINEGKLAVVLGIENSKIFGCDELLDQPECTREDIDRGIDEVYRLGVRSLFPVHKFDNAIGGTRFDGGPVGAAINAGQFEQTGHFWDAETCTGDAHDNELFTGLPSAEGGDIIEVGLAAFGRPLSAPVYPPAPHCNTRGLTGLGGYLIRRLTEKGIMVEVDHMSVRAADAALEILERRDYSGVLSSHEWSDPSQFRRILELGGMVGGRANNVENFADEWREYRAQRSPGFYFGWGYGADSNGLGNQSSPSSDAGTVSYPFESELGGVSFDRQKSGRRVFDVNTDGVAHYGMHPDWIEDLRLYAGDGIVRDMFRGSEAYLQTWERAWGIPHERCLGRRARITRAGLAAIELGDSPKRLLVEMGQPSRRVGDSYRYCVRGEGDERVLAGFDPADRVRVVAGNGARHSAGGIVVGDRKRSLRTIARRLGGGLWIERARSGKARYVYGSSSGRVDLAGVASGPVGRDGDALREALRPLR